MGWSKVRLSRMHDVLARYVERGEVPGIVTLLKRGGETVVDTIGNAQRDTIFRISSMTKPVAAAAAMILVEECRLRLDDPVDPYLPELANRKVLRTIDAELDDTVPAKRPVSLRDLLTFTMGFGILWGTGVTPIQAAVREQELGCLGPPTAVPHTPDAWMKRFGELPLMYQPGERWLYNTGSYVLGVLIARASGKTLDAFLQERIFGPLKMKDTAFFVPQDKIGRLTTSYWTNPLTEKLDVFDPVNGLYSKAPVFPDAAAGLVATIDDYAAFGSMMLGRGQLGGTRILARASVDAMTSEQITPKQKLGSWLPGNWGFGLAVDTHRTHLHTTPGRFGWDGGLGTAWASDPKEGLVAILMTQRGGFPAQSGVYQDFWTLAYQALDE